MKRFKFGKRLVCLCLAATLISTDAYATIKQVHVWGAKLINDLGNSDYRVDMDKLKEDYSGYLQTDGLTEYFHKDRTTSARADMTEALGWLIDNNIVSRDEVVSVNNLYDVPSVNISKIEAGSFLQTHVNRSDALMYIYKAVFGPLEGRAIGVETPNVRSDNGYQDTLYNIMLKNDYFTTIAEGNKATIKQEKTSGGKAGSGGHHIEIISDGYYFHEDTGGTGGSGGDAGGQEIGVNTESKWRYTPQGDEYISVFGDTNIFISDVEIQQDVDASGGDSTGSHGGGAAGSGGGVNAAISYETDYKQIYFTPGADVLFYNTSDVLEMYLQAILSKGIMKGTLPPTTDKFKEKVAAWSQQNALPSWSGDADPYVVNRAAVKKWRVENVTYEQLKDTLGVNYTVHFNGNNLTIRRTNIFNCDSGYFESEYMTRMDAYRYIYEMLGANEKKISQLEADIVNYKYGLNLDGLASDEDTEAIKVLVAKGILDFDGSADLMGLYSPLLYTDFFDVLYRVANPNARLDFSKIQLTDSETQWKARGFQSQTMAVVDSAGVGTLVINTPDEESEEEEGTDIENGQTPLTESPSEGEMSATLLHNAPLAGEWSDLTYRVAPKCLVMNDVSFDMTGTTGSNGISSIPSLVQEVAAVATSYNGLNTAELGNQANWLSDSDSNNRVNRLKSMFTHNFWAILYYRNNPGLTDIQGILNEASNECVSLYEDSLSTKEKEYFKSAKATIDGLRSDIDIYHIGYDIVGNISLSGANGQSSSTPTGSIEGIYGSLAVVNFSIAGDSETGKMVDCTMTFNTDEVRNVISQSGDRLGESLAGKTVSLDCTFTDADGLELSGQEVASRFKKLFASKDANTAVANGSGLSIQVDPTGKDAFIPWSEIDSNKLGITRGAGGTLLANSEWILNCNGTRAVFSNGTQGTIMGSNDTQIMATALVGTTVIKGDSQLGVAYKEDGEVYYHINAIRLLLNANQETNISTIKTLAVPSVDFSKVVTNYQLMSESGSVDGAMSAVRARVDTSSTLSGFVGEYKSSLVASGDGGYWGNFVTMSQASRVKNIVSRKLVFTPDGSKDSLTAYAVLEFYPVDMTKYSTATVNNGTMLEDILDAPAKAPTSEEELGSYNKNILASNAYCNWIYGTTGAKYVNTGYMKPELTLYVVKSGNAPDLPSSIFSSLQNVEDAEELIKAVQVRTMNAVENGAAYWRHKSLNSGAQDYIDQVTNASNVQYWVSTDCKVLVTGDRVYINETALDNVSFRRNDDPKKAHYILKSNVAMSASFTVGNTFTVLGDSTSTKVTVLERDGADVVCQVGPVFGVPIIYDGEMHVLKPGGIMTDTRTLGELNFATDSEKSPEKFDDYVQWKFYTMFRGRGNQSYGSVKFDGIMNSPYETNTQSPSVVNREKGIWIDGLKYTSLDAMSLSSSTTVKDYATRIQRAIGNGLSGNTSGLGMCKNYFQIRFPAADFKVVGGVLEKGSSTASDFISPSLFTSINDLIIDGLINESVGGIPINQIEEGALLLVGNNEYQCTGTSSGSKEFVGYSSVPAGTKFASLQSASYSFASHMIKAGNQAVNVSHFFDVFSIVDETDKSQTKRLEALRNVSTYCFKSENTRYNSVTQHGGSLLVKGKLTDKESKTFVAVAIAFSDYLLAYQTRAGDATTGEPARYSILPSAVANGEESSAVSGAFENVPFFTDSAIVTGIAERTGSYISANYQPSLSASRLREHLKLEFQKVFAGDLLTLARMLMFIVLMWLMVASWVCYAARLANLLPILDAIKYPTGNRQSKGLDLFRLVSLGTISLDTEFKLGKFLAYNGIIACLMLVVEYSAYIPLGR